MEVSSVPAKRVRAKSKDAAAKPAPARKPRSKRTALAAEPLDVVAIQPDAANRMTGDLTSAIETTAYLIAAGRGFAPGHELDDWLEAERRVREFRTS